MQCPRCDTEMTQEKYNEGKDNALRRVVLEYFKLVGGKLYRKVACGEYKRVHPCYQVTLPGGVRTLYYKIVNMLKEASGETPDAKPPRFVDGIFKCPNGGYRVHVVGKTMKCATKQEAEKIRDELRNR